MSAAVAMPTPAEAPRLTLLDLDSSILELLDSIDMIPADMPGHIAEAEEELRHLIAARLRKVDGINYMLIHLASQSELAKQEIDRLTKRKKRFEQSAERLTDYVIFAMKATEQKRLDGDTCSARLMTAQPRLEITDADAVPAEYTTTTTVVETTTNTAAIKKALKTGEPVPGARLLDGKEYLKWS